MVKSYHLFPPLVMRVFAQGDLLAGVLRARRWGHNITNDSAEKPSSLFPTRGFAAAGRFLRGQITSAAIKR